MVRRARIPLALLATALVALGLAARPAAAQAPPPGPPIRLLPHPNEQPPPEPPVPPLPTMKPAPPGASPEQRVDLAIEHLKEIQDELSNPPPLPPPDPTRPEDARLRRDRQLYQRYETALACLLALHDLVFDLARAGQQAYKDDPQKQEQFRKKLAEFEAAKGTPQQQTDFLEKAIEDGFRRSRRVYFGTLLEDWLHELYHLANTKKITEGKALGIGAFWSPLQVWTGLDCQGAECRDQTAEEQKRLQPTRPR